MAEAERSGYSADREGGREKEACQNEETERGREGGSCVLRAMDMSSESLDGTTFPRRPFGGGGWMFAVSQSAAVEEEDADVTVGRWTP